MFDLNFIKGKWNIVQSTDEYYLKEINRRLNINFKIKNSSILEVRKLKKEKVRVYSKKYKNKNGILCFNRKFLFFKLPIKFCVIGYDENSEWLIIARINSILNKLQIDVLSRGNQLNSNDIYIIRKKISSIDYTAGYLKYLKNVN
ncbi:hypothetical protein [Oceanirhabdus sp. W0125-5]|uniref:hypothetical protein n=1 Tax=Oceanirhabdus sp. W0125-5 TaxID=2999116 RepID=UPI0022F3089D|nr:hypothetical protein [Oceanirhabdus sp. W0125-5]WBW99646.1 hypothetical protein OW730_13120 [Oceanirhabdus sp. W0125-5]